MILGLAALALGGAGPAAPSYPAAADRESLSAWLREATDLPPEQVVAVSPSAATAIVDRAPASNGRVGARLRAVAITPQAAARSGVLAWEMRLEVNCRSGEVRSGATVGYATRRAGAAEGVALAPADAAWRRPKPNTTLDASWRAICDANFQSPLAGGQVRIAKTAPDEPVGPSATTAAPALAPAPIAAPPVALARNPAPPRLASVPPAAGPPPTFAPVAPPSETAKPVRLAAATAPSAKRKPAAPPPSMGGRAAVQVVSSPIEADTRKKLASLQHRFGASLQGMEPRIVSAKVRGQTVYRGVLAGFASAGDARAFCKTLKQGGHDCLTL